jgi:hypothetical protein
MTTPYMGPEQAEWRREMQRAVKDLALRVLAETPAEQRAALLTAAMLEKLRAV